MEPNYDIHLGLVVSSSPDPEGRNRVQVWIPYLSNTLYGSLNQKLKDVHFKGPEDLNTIDKDILITLQATLPWAECAAPLFGGSSGAFNTATGQTAVNSGSTLQTNNNSDSGLPTTSANMNTTGTKPLDIKGYNNLPVLSPSRMNSRSNNPGNLHTVSSPYIGQVGSNADIAAAGKYGAGIVNTGNVAFFDTLPNGIAQNLKQINIDISRGGNNIQNLAASWVGGSQANINEAIRVWSQSSGISPTTPLDPNNQEQMKALLAGISVNEGGGIPADYSSAFDAGYNIFQQRNAGNIAASTTTQSGSKGVVYPDRAAAIGCVASNVGTPGSPVGTFSIPNGGTKVWVFFMGGDIQRPVYFAQAPNPGDINALRG